MLAKEDKHIMNKHWGLSILHIPHFAHQTLLICSITAVITIDKQTKFTCVG